MGRFDRFDSLSTLSSQHQVPDFGKPPIDPYTYNT
jgi:hypothetical protein